MYCNRGGWVGLELYCNTVTVLQAEKLDWLAVSQYNRSVLWLGKGLLGESRYKICIVTEAASVAGRAGRAGRATGTRAQLGHGVGERGVRRQALGAGTDRRHARGRAGRGRLAGRGARGACYRRARGPRPGQGCALGALGLFSTRFDSVLFLSQFFDIVREPGS